jgi:hypothetical protein
MNKNSNQEEKIVRTKGLATNFVPKKAHTPKADH